jgi:hypothetical protein
VTANSGQAERKPKVQPDHVADDFGEVAMPSIKRVQKGLHPAQIPDHFDPPQIQLPLNLTVPWRDPRLSSGALLGFRRSMRLNPFLKPVAAHSLVPRISL